MKSIYLTAIISGVMLVAGCAGKSVTVTHSQDLPNLIGRRVTMTGTAIHNCPGAMVFAEDCQVLIDGMKYWPTNYDLKRVQVTGHLGEQHGPDLYVIRDAEWKLLP
jgi:hypothetical protein